LIVNNLSEKEISNLRAALESNLYWITMQIAGNS
jgi:tRNA threonylcarbamoyladenosine modification (KEOPS) complex  Pcc1 subunit